MKVPVRSMALACALACAVQAGGAWAADLLGVVEDTLDHDATLAAARDAYRATAQAVPKARAGLLPRVDGGWGRQYNSIAMDGFPAAHYWQNGWTVVLTQPLFDWAQWSAWRQADYVVARGQLEAASAGQDAILRAAQVYFDVLGASDEVVRADDYLRALDAHLALLSRAKAAGEATLVDLREAEASRAQAQLQLLDARERAALARAALERLTGKPAEALAALPERAAMPALEPADPQPWITQAQARGYPVQIRELALQIAKLDTEKARAGHYPRVDLQVTHTPAGAGGGYTRPSTTTTALFAVQIPLFSGGETKARVVEAQALEDKARNELEAAARAAAGAARDGVQRTTSGRARIAAMQTLVQRAEASLEATRIGFGVGSRASTDVLRATDAFYAGRRDLIRARYDTVLALLRLLADTASLNLDEVARINAQLYAQLASAPSTAGSIPADAVPHVAAESRAPAASPRVAGAGRIEARTVSPAVLAAGAGLRASVPAIAPDAMSTNGARAIPAVEAVESGRLAGVRPSDSTAVSASTEPTRTSNARHPASAAEMAPAIPAALHATGTPLR